jgi:CHAD domain-containing protein
MDSQFKEFESLAAGTQRIVEMQLVAALEHLKIPPERRDEGIHECRKCLKYARALLRLVATGMPGGAFRKWNVTLRDASRCISDLRDAKAMLECLDAVTAETCPEEADRAPFLACRNALSQPADLGRQTGLAEAAAEKAFLLISGKLTTPHDPTLGRGREARILREGLRRSYALGRRAMKRARKKGGVEAFHEWRKRAKDLRYQVAMLRAVWPGTCDALEGELHHLTDYLGRVHDLHVLERALAALPPGAVSDEALSAVRSRADRSAETAAAGALRLGARLYGDKPRMFADRVAGWWMLWRDEPSRRDGVVEQNGEGTKHE